MYMRSKTSRLSPRKTVQIVEAYVTEDGKRRQRIVQHLGVAFDEAQLREMWTLGERLIPELEARAREERAFRKGQGIVFPVKSEDFEREISEGESVRIRGLRNEEHVLEGPFEVWGEVFARLGLEGIFGTGIHDIGATNLLKLCLTAKLTEGGSKRRAAEWINSRLGLSLPVDRIYRMMDRLSEKVETVRQIGMKRGRYLCDNRVSLALFDVTTLYFESFREDEGESEGGDDRNSGRTAASPASCGLRRRGYSKDNRINETQVVLALAATREGIPLWCGLYPGNTAEGKTLVDALEETRSALTPEETCFVGDNAMLNATNRKELEARGFTYILGSSVRKLADEEKKEALDIGGYLELGIGNGAGESAGKEKTYYRTIRRKNGNTQLVTWKRVRAERDAHKRKVLLERLEKQLDANWEILSDRLIRNRGTKKYVEAVEKETKYRMNLERIERDAQYDGLHGIETNRQVETEDDVRDVLGAYGTLWRIEEDFRIAKSDLRIRPDFHWTEKRIRSHIAICFLALLMEKYLDVQLRNKRKRGMSAGAIREALLQVQSSLLRDYDTGKLYRLPVRMGEKSREIYKAVGLKRTGAPTEITSLVKYRHRIPKCEGPKLPTREMSENEDAAEETGP